MALSAIPPYAHFALGLFYLSDELLEVDSHSLGFHKSSGTICTASGARSLKMQPKLLGIVI